MWNTIQRFWLFRNHLGNWKWNFASTSNLSFILWLEIEIDRHSYFNYYHLKLPIPSTCPEGFSLLIKQVRNDFKWNVFPMLNSFLVSWKCWSKKPKNRPSFRIILNHLEIAGNELANQYEHESYCEKQKTWQKEIQTQLQSDIKNSTRTEQVRSKPAYNYQVSFHLQFFIFLSSFRSW